MTDTYLGGLPEPAVKAGEFGLNPPLWKESQVRAAIAADRASQATAELPRLPTLRGFNDMTNTSIGAWALAYGRECYEAGRASRAQSEWRPMDSAPKDGTHFLAMLPDSDTCHVICWVDASKGIRVGCGTYGWHVAWDGYPCAGYSTPTHWMPLPPAPATLGETK